MSQGYLFEEARPTLDTQYVKTVSAPLYEPTGQRPKLHELCDENRTQKLLARIKRSDVPQEIKDFLVKAAHRHHKFNYQLIAEYYAHADADVQELMQDSALVIIDFDRAIEDGYVKLSESIRECYDEDHPE